MRDAQTYKVDSLPCLYRKPRRRDPGHLRLSSGTSLVCLTQCIVEKIFIVWVCIYIDRWIGE